MSPETHPDSDRTTIFEPGADSLDWVNVDDPVMGGLSRSQTRVVEREDGLALVFAGEVSLRNNGGFCSTRTEGATWRLPAELQTFEVTIRGDGKRYKFTVRTTDHDAGSYRHAFDTKPGERTTLAFDVAAFEMYRRGTHLPDAPPLDPTTIRSLGFLVSDGQEGAFELEVARIAAT